MCTWVHGKARKGSLVSWSFCYRQSCVSHLWLVLGMEFGSSTGAKGSFNHWSISPAAGFTFNFPSENLWTCNLRLITNKTCFIVIWFSKMERATASVLLSLSLFVSYPSSPLRILSNDTNVLQVPLVGICPALFSLQSLKEHTVWIGVKTIATWWLQSWCPFKQGFKRLKAMIYLVVLFWCINGIYLTCYDPISFFNKAVLCTFLGRWPEVGAVNVSYLPCEWMSLKNLCQMHYVFAEVIFSS